MRLASSGDRSSKLLNAPCMISILTEDLLKKKKKLSYKKCVILPQIKWRSLVGRDVKVFFCDPKPSRPV